MQTKNINIERAPNNEKTTGSLIIQQQHHRNEPPEGIPTGNGGAPPLPPRTAIIFTPLPATTTTTKLPGRTVRQVKHGERLRRSQNSLSPLTSLDDTHQLQQQKQNEGVAKIIKTSTFVEVEGYGPYKPVPPPKPYPQQAGQTPPPYRMPPYPLYNEPNIPGAAGLVDSQQQQQQQQQPPATGINQGLHTHSNKFPIEREVILSNTDKNSKIPILHDYKKRTTKGGAIIAPDIPPKQMAAWTQQQQQQQQILSPDQTHSGMIQTVAQPQPQPPPSQQQQQQQQQDNGPVYRANYHSGQEYYNGSTGAVPRQSWHGPDPNKPALRTYPAQQPQQQHSEEMAAQVDNSTSNNNNNNKDNSKENQQKPAKTMTKTYHTIKDMISSKFKSNTNNSSSSSSSSNNNSNNNNNREVDEKNEEAGLNNVTEELRRSQRNVNEELQEKKQSTDHGIYGKPRIDQYSQHMMLVQQAQINQQIKIQQQYQQQLIQARSQEMLATTTTATPNEQIYYQQSYGATPQRPTNRFIPNQNYPQQQMKRSAQQIERDSLRQKSFEARRAASHPQLTYEDETCKPDQEHHRPQPQQSRRGSHGNLVEAIQITQDKDSDDGGFLERNNRHDEQNKDDDSGKLAETLQGTPRKKLEGEIGKIEGVYNVGQRSVKQDDLNKKQSGSAASSDYDKTGGQSSSNVDSGRGSAAYSSGRRAPINETCDNYTKNDQDSEWVDIVESELRHILEPKLHELSLHGTAGGGGRPNSTLSESISSMTPPLPPLSPGDEQSSPNITPRNSGRYGKHVSNSLPYGSKPDYDGYNKATKLHQAASSKEQQKWYNGNASNQKHRNTKKFDYTAILRGKQIFGLDTTDLTSTTTRSLDLESMLDGQTDSEVDLSTADARTIRKQLEGLETMYSEVLKLLGVKKTLNSRYQPSDPRFNKRRCYGSMSSLPSSSVSSRPIRDKRRSNIYDDRKKVRDLRGINKRFQRLESHVVTLARSVAHLSSEMRTQHLMIQEMENIRTEIAALRTQTNMLNVRSQSIQRSVNTSKELPTLANPTRVKKLTKFFGDEPPLLRLFLRKLGYEKYANVFENERIGMVELPYLSEERLQKMGVPLGPRLRIMQEAQISVCKENTLCIV